MADEKPVCMFNTCDGSGFIEVNEDTSARCRCSLVRALIRHLGPDIAAAPDINESPLYKVNPQAARAGESPLVDKTQSNLFLKGWWTDLLPHLKFVLIAKGIDFPYRIVTDERLKTIYVGAEAYLSRSRKRREDGDSYNSLSDLIGPEFKLIVVRMGFLGHRNVAMPGILKEALMLRQAAGRATWLVEEPDRLFGPYHRAYDEDVASYIDRHFEVIDLTSEEKPEAEQKNHDAPIPDEEDFTMGAEEPEKKPAPKPKPKPAVQSVFTEERPAKVALAADPLLERTWSGSKKGNFKKRSGGGGPAGDNL
jgi:hypothetical protein